MGQEASVQNAADKSQVKDSRTKEKMVRFQELEDLKKIIATDYGRRFLWRMLGAGKTFESIWEPSAKIHYNAGWQDFGHFIMAEIVEANPVGLVQMMQENNTANSKTS